MSVYRPRKADGTLGAEYVYDFRFRGRRFSGSTGETDRRRAEGVERQKREAAKAAAPKDAADLTFREAVARYWGEVGQFHRNAIDTERSLAWLVARIGRQTKLSKITNQKVAELVALRRADTAPQSKEAKERGDAPEPISNATVNRQVIEPLRGILRRAADVWDQDVAKIDWKRHALAEKREHVREASIEEEEKILAAIRPDYRPLVRFAFMNGCRLAELVGLAWADVDWFNREFTVTGKGDKSRTIPMTRETHELLWEIKDHHPEAVFTYIAEKTREMADGRRVRGRRYPVTYQGVKTEWRRAIAGSGVENFRFHDMRHTAASRTARATGDLRITRDLLGHEDIATTTRYAHLTRKDLRAGLEATHAAIGKEMERKKKERGG